jgi:hypothetical protein
VRLAPLCLPWALAGCASLLEVRPLATARADQSAYELSGSDLAALRHEAGQLCPAGGEVLRQAAREQRPQAADSRMERWMTVPSAWISPPERQAQLVVLCNPVVNRHLLTVAAAVPVDGAASVPGLAAALGAPVAPIGPVSVEW